MLYLSFRIFGQVQYKAYYVAPHKFISKMDWYNRPTWLERIQLFFVMGWTEWLFCPVATPGMSA